MFKNVWGENNAPLNMQKQLCQRDPVTLSIFCILYCRAACDLLMSYCLAAETC